MNINQNNYESFFLLYVDNELSAAEILCVEAFIKEHPYLATELQILKGMVVPAEKMSLGDKDILYRSASFQGNLQEAMLLQLDNELPQADSEALQHKIDEDQTISAGWELLKKTRLDVNDKVTFPHKKSLYRREKPGVVVYGKFTRWAVAAALIAAGFFAGVAIITKQEQEQTNLSNVINKKSTEKGIVITKPGNLAKPAEKSSQATEEVNMPEAINEQYPALAEVSSTNQERTSVRRKTAATIKAVDIHPSETNKALPANKNNSHQTVLAAENKKLKITEAGRQEVSTILASLSERPGQRVEIVDRDQTPIENIYAHNTLMEEPQNDNHILFMDEDVVARTRAGILFKKLKRTVTRSTSIKPGNSLKIAGLEFAIK